MSEMARDFPGITAGRFARDILLALATLAAVAALVLLVLTGMSSPPGATFRSDGWQQAALAPTAGQVKPAADRTEIQFTARQSMAVTRLKAGEIAPQAMLAIRGEVNGLDSGVTGAVYWKRRAAADFHTIPLQVAQGKHFQVRVAGHEDWREVAEAGLVFWGRPGAAVEISAIQVIADSWLSRTRVALAAALTPESWSHRSMNSLRFGDLGGAISLSLIAVIASLASAATFCCFYLLHRDKGVLSRRILAVIVLAWLVADLAWINTRASNANEAMQRFRGLQPAQQIETLYGKWIFSLATELARIAQDDGRVLISYHWASGSYHPMVLQYLLTPRNVFAVSHLLPDVVPRHGDTLLVLKTGKGEFPDSFREFRRRLPQREGNFTLQRLQAERTYDIYQIVAKSS
jgi:hypothetical protein